MDNGEQDPELYHPKFVADALSWAETLTSQELLAAAQISDATSEGYLPSGALVRLVRRLRLEGKKELSDRLVRPLLVRALNYSKRMFARLGRSDADDISQEAVRAFLTDLAGTDVIDWWEITFARELRRCASDAYVRLIRNHRRRDVEFGGEHERNDDGAAAEELHIHGLLVAFANKSFDSEEKRRLFVLLMKGTLPIDAPQARMDLVRLTGKAASTLRNLKTEFARLLTAALAEDGK